MEGDCRSLAGSDRTVHDVVEGSELDNCFHESSVVGNTVVAEDDHNYCEELEGEI